MSKEPATVEVIVTKAYDGYNPGDHIHVSKADYPRLYRKGRIRDMVDARAAARRGRRGDVPPPVSIPSRFKFVGPDETEDPGPTMTPKKEPDIKEDPVPTVKDDPKPTVAKPRVDIVTEGKGWWQVYINGVPVTNEGGATRNFRRAAAETYRDDYLKEVGAA